MSKENIVEEKEKTTPTLHTNSLISLYDSLSRKNYDVEAGFALYEILGEYESHEISRSILLISEGDYDECSETKEEGRKRREMELLKSRTEMTKHYAESFKSWRFLDLNEGPELFDVYNQEFILYNILPEDFGAYITGDKSLATSLKKVYFTVYDLMDEDEDCAEITLNFKDKTYYIDNPSLADRLKQSSKFLGFKEIEKENYLF